MPWIVMVRDVRQEDLSSVLSLGADADVIIISRRTATARLSRSGLLARDIPAAVLATAPPTFRMIRRAERQGARVLDITVPAANPRPLGIMPADVLHQ